MSQLFKRIGHSAYTVSDMDRSLHFYCNILDFKKLFEIRKKADEPWIVYLGVVEGQFIELFYGGTKSVTIDTETIGYSHLCLEVFDIHESAKHIKSHGITLDAEPRLLDLDHNWQCWVKDPDGNRIEIMQLMEDSPHMTIKM